MLASAPASPITLPEALRRTAQGNPDLVAQGLSTRAIEALRVQADLRPNPIVGVELENFAGTGPFQSLDGSVVTLQASQRIERGDKRTQRLAFADARSDAARRALTWQLNRLRRDTTAAFVEVLIAERQVALAQRMLKSITSITTTIDQAVAAGHESAAEATRAQVAWVRARVALGQATANREKAKQSLALLWGDNNTDFVLASTLPPVAAVPD